VITNVFFGGYPVSISFIGEEVLVTCKGVTGTLEQLDYWLQQHRKNNFEKFYFGYGGKLSEIVRDGEEVKIACLSENYQSFKLKLNKFIHDVNRQKTVRRAEQRFSH
jgi:hypothetical protein